MVWLRLLVIAVIVVATAAVGRRRRVVEEGRSRSALLFLFVLHLREEHSAGSATATRLSTIIATHVVFAATGLGIHASSDDGGEVHRRRSLCCLRGETTRRPRVIHVERRGARREMFAHRLLDVLCGELLLFQMGRFLLLFHGGEIGLLPVQHLALLAQLGRYFVVLHSGLMQADRARGVLRRWWT